MNPNKNNSKNNSPWLLCPSKSFPGKFYYFNGSTGETAWSLSESDHNLKKDGTQKVADDAHAYRDKPFDPPADESTNTSSLSTLKKDYINNTNFNNANNFSNKTSFQNMTAFNKGTNFNHTNFTNQTSFSLGSNLNGGRNFSGNLNKPAQIGFDPISPTFGQAVFPTYVNKPTKVIWTLTPMFINEQHQMLDQITQYEPPDTFLPTPVMLNNQFQNFKPSRHQTNPFKPNSSTQGVQTGPLFSQKVTYESKDVQTFDQEPHTKDKACQTFEPETREVQPSAPKLVRPSKFVEKSASISVGISTLSLEKKPDDAIEVEVDDAANKMSALKKNDLRFLLEAKRRKSVDLGVVLKSTKESSNILKIQSEDQVPKKRVTFDLGCKDESEEIQEDIKPDATGTSTNCIEESCIRSDRAWYIVADAEVLIKDYDCVERNVLNAQKCRLLVPFVVKSEIEALSRGECWGSREVFTARLITRKLAAPKPYIVLQRKPETTIKCDEYSILDCCMQFSQYDCDLTLLTTSTSLLEKARLIGVDCSLYDPLRPETMEVPAKDSSTSSFDNENLDDMPIKNKANTDKLIELTNTYKVVNDINHFESVDIDISKLDITDEGLSRKNRSDVINVCKKLNHKERIRDVNERNVNDVIKVSSITKLNSVFNLDDELARYYVKSEDMEARLLSRRDEWICRLSQATEGVLIDILIKEKVKKNMPPLDLCEAVQTVGVTLKNQSKIRNISEKMSLHLQKSNFAKYNKTKPADFMRLLGFCMVLVQSLKEIVDYVELNDADDLLSELVKHVEDPNTDVEFNLDKVQTPVLSDTEFQNKVPVGYRTKQSDVLEYLKKHFPAMQSYQLEKTEPKIVRTIGKDLKSIKMFNGKPIVVDTTGLQDVTRKAVEPVVLKNFKIIDAYEEKLKKVNDEDALDYEESLSMIFSDQTYVVNDKIDSTHTKNETTETNAKNDSAEDSTVESCSSDLNNECIYAFPLMKAFLAELKGTLALIFNFVSDSLQDFQKNSISENKRTELDIKMNMAHKYILKIVDRLKSIIARESGQGTTLKMLLIQAGDYVEENETMSQYKELVTKYLEQAQILEEALKIMLTIENVDLEAISSNSALSVILPCHGSNFLCK